MRQVDCYGEPFNRRKPRYRFLVLMLLLAVVGSTPALAQELASAGNQNMDWLGKLAARYEAAATRAEALLDKAQVSVANSRNIQAQAKLSANPTLRIRAEKTLANAEAVQRKAKADLLATRSALAVLRGGRAATISGAPTVFVSLDQDADYTAVSGSEPTATAFFGINPGDRLETGPAGRARLHLLDNGLETELQLGAASQLVARGREQDDPTTRLVLQQGAARVIDVARLPEAQAAAAKRKSALDTFFGCLEKDGADYYICAYGYLKAQVNKSRFEMRTPAIAIAVRGTDYLIEHDGATGVTLLKVLEGEVALLSDRYGQALLVRAGHAARADDSGLTLLEAGVDAVAERGPWEE
jgi:hypothetical protein